MESRTISPTLHYLLNQRIEQQLCLNLVDEIQHLVRQLDGLDIRAETVMLMNGIVAVSIFVRVVGSELSTLKFDDCIGADELQLSSSQTSTNSTTNSLFGSIGVNSCKLRYAIHELRDSNRRCEIHIVRSSESNLAIIVCTISRKCVSEDETITNTVILFVHANAFQSGDDSCHDCNIQLL